MKTLYVSDRKKWRAWLEKNFENAKEIWLLFPHKSSCKTRVSYNDAVEEALCFGWIDSIIRAYDKEHSAQRFSPRKPKSNYSQPNRERLQWLSERKMLHPSIHKTVSDILKEKFIFPTDIIKAIKKSDAAWKKYQQFSDSYKRIRIAFIDAARKRPEEFTKRLQNFIGKTEKGLLIKGFGGIDKYY